MSSTYWDFSHSGKKLIPALLRRGAAISTELAAVAEAARQRIAEITDEDDIPAVTVTADQS